MGPRKRLRRQNPVVGKNIFAEKGCVVCHQMNGIGGKDGPNLTYGEYDTPVNAMEVASDLWEKADIMIPMQKDELGGQIILSPEELSGLIAFLADPEMQKTFTKADIPADIRQRHGRHVSAQGAGWIAWRDRLRTGRGLLVRGPLSAGRFPPGPVASPSADRCRQCARRQDRAGCRQGQGSASPERRAAARLGCG